VPETADRARVDVLVVTHNSAAVTADALGRLLAVDHGSDLRVLVHDNASSDGTIAALQALPGVEIEAGDENLGFGRAMNRLFERSDAPWVLVLNSDAWPEPGAIAALLATATAGRTAVVVPRLEHPDGSLDHSTYPFPTLEVGARCALGYRHAGRRRARELCLPGAWLHDERRTVGWAVAACWLVPRAALDTVGGFDERLFLYAEDLEWCWHAADRELPVVFEPAAVFRHIGGASTEPLLGAGREGRWMANTYRVVRWRRGTAYAAAYRTLNLAGCLRQWALARARRDHAAAATWSASFRANLASARGVDAPP
jgi:N-acetylglucosaminyl-diphospho-decaprenol L-rhamnosyltransferase